MPPSFFNDTATAEFCPLSLPDALPISPLRRTTSASDSSPFRVSISAFNSAMVRRSEEHTSELQSRLHLVCRLLFLMIRRPPSSALFPYPTLFRSPRCDVPQAPAPPAPSGSLSPPSTRQWCGDRKSTRLNSSHGYISYAAFFF